MNVCSSCTSDHTAYLVSCSLPIPKDGVQRELWLPPLCKLLPSVSCSPYWF